MVFANKSNERILNTRAEPVFPHFHQFNVAMKRSNSSKKLLVSIALTAACAFAVWVSFGPHLRRASSDIIDETFYCAPQYVALREHQFGAEKPAEGMVRCIFGDLTFELPSTMAGWSRNHGTWVRRKKEDLHEPFAVFEDKPGARW